MDTKAQKDRLEQELRFLKESFEAEVISKEEFEKGKERIERKLNEIDYVHSSDAEKKIEEAKGPTIQEKENEGIIKEAEQERKTYEKEHAKEGKNIEKHVETKHEEPKSSGKGSSFWKYATIFIVLIFIALLGFNYMLSKSKTNQVNARVLCSTDSECTQSGKVGTCMDAGKETSKCGFRDVKKTNVIVLNDETSCLNCDTARVINILEEWFGPLNVTEISYSSVEGRGIAEEYGAKFLPLYILDGEIENKVAFSQFQKSFSKKDDSYVLSDRISGASIYLERNEMPKKLDLFVKENDPTSKKAEDNLQEFLDNFKDVKFEKHSSQSQLAKDLGLNTFPTFIVNNRVRFGGVNSADSIKENYCKLNKDDNCDKTLSTNLK